MRILVPYRITAEQTMSHSLMLKFREKIKNSIFQYSISYLTFTVQEIGDCNCSGYAKNNRIGDPHKSQRTYFKRVGRKIARLTAVVAVFVLQIHSDFHIQYY